LSKLSLEEVNSSTITTQVEVEEVAEEADSSQVKKKIQKKTTTSCWASRRMPPRQR